VTEAAPDGSLRVELFVADVRRSAAFYTDVLGFTREAENDGYVAVRRGAAVIGIGRASELPASHPLHARDGDRNGIGVEIVVEVADVDAAYRTVTDAGWPALGPVKQRPWGARDFRLLDPDGYYVRVTSMVEPG
jgi:catechol 2,3-dioxygenase-like lactoylglutathione lyase family enzyme